MFTLSVRFRRNLYLLALAGCLLAPLPLRELLFASPSAPMDENAPIHIASLSSTPQWVGESDQEFSDFGLSVATAGDVNGDGYADIIVGARNYDGIQNVVGAAFIYHGGPAGPSLTPDWLAMGEQIAAGFARIVSTAGDVNGDGYDDVIVGAPFYKNSLSSEGAAFVYHGGPAGLSPTPDWIGWGNQSSALFGLGAGTAGDVNGDGYADVIIGASSYDGDLVGAGRVFVYHGGPAGLPATPNWTVDGDQSFVFFGEAVGTAGDVNRDGYDDVIIGAWLYENGQTDEGRAFVYHGGPAGLAATPAWSAESNQESAYFGSSLGTAGDVNGDGYDDVIVGAYLYDSFFSDAGRAFVYHGGPAGLSATPAWTQDGQGPDDSLGIAVAWAGDVNGDLFDDVIIGALNYSNGQFEEGAAYVYAGGAAGLAANSMWQAEGDQVESEFGRAVGTAGDVDGDGYPNVMVGAREYDDEETNEGRVFVYGRPVLTPAVYLPIVQRP